MKIRSPWPWPQGHPRVGDGADKNFRPISTIMPNMKEIHQWVFKIWGLINFNAKTLTLTFLWKFCDLDPKVTPGVGMVMIKTLDLYLPSSQKLNESHQRVFKIWGLKNFNAKTLTLWRKDERTNVRTNIRMNGKAKTIYPHILRMSGV